MSRPIVTSLTLGAAVTNGYCLSQTPGAAGALTLNGSLVTAGVGKPDVPRRVAITSAGQDISNRTFVITGTARSEQGGAAITETITGPAASAVVFTNQDFATVTGITISGSAAGAITVGTNTVASGPWVVWDGYVSPMNIGLAGQVISGTPTWEVDVTYDDAFGTWLAPGVTYPTAIPFLPYVALTGSANGPINENIRASRLTLTAVGGVRLTQMQQGM